MDSEKYARLSSDDEDMSVEAALLFPTTKSSRHGPRRAYLQWLLHLILLSISGSLALYAWITTGTLPANVRLEAQTRHEQWRTVMGNTPENYHSRRFDGDFIISDAYKGPPNDQVDAAWKRLIPEGALQVDQDVFSALNASRFSVEVPEDIGEGYLAYFESVHYIHCVFSLWQTTWPEYYKDKHQFSIEYPDSWHFHLDHCADILRQKLMCDADVGMFGYNWIKNHYAPHANFNVQHKCRDYEAVLEYAEAHRADKEDRYMNYFLRPEDRPSVNYKAPPFDPFVEGDAEVKTS